MYPCSTCVTIGSFLDLRHKRNTIFLINDALIATEFDIAALVGVLQSILFVEVTFNNLMFSLQPSKLDLDVFIAIGQVDLDARKFPNIAQWKKLVMSYSEATQQRLHFIYFNFKLIHGFLLLYSVALSSLPASPLPLWLPCSLPLSHTASPP